MAKCRVVFVLVVGKLGLISADETNVKIKLGNNLYRWQEPWLTLSGSERGWAHHGLAVLQNGHIVSGHAARPVLVEVDNNGNVIKQTELAVSEIHHICTRNSAGDDSLLICDLGDKDLAADLKTIPKGD